MGASRFTSSDETKPRIRVSRIKYTLNRVPIVNQEPSSFESSSKRRSNGQRACKRRRAEKGYRLSQQPPPSTNFLMQFYLGYTRVELRHGKAEKGYPGLLFHRDRRSVPCKLLYRGKKPPECYR
ncbi:uncharacterized protein LOC122527617 [Frieseomelitta varia]|uniref:uncharacterized protein LOC122527617 n=1 Tax=Frieseomelitta varia TaxID=561572 RepID=UPI001CB67A86|nr:uncharacterized protein LOC122527617 [Frieseomelitta varia]